MKATLEFDLEDYHDKLAHKRAITATDAYIALHDIKEYLFKKDSEHLTHVLDIINNYVNMDDLE